MMYNNDIFGGDGGNDFLRGRLFRRPGDGYGMPLGDPMTVQQRPVMMAQAIQPMTPPGNPPPVPGWEQTQKNWKGAGDTVKSAISLVGA